MDRLDILFIGSVMNYDGELGSYAHYINENGKWIAPFQYIYRQRPELFESEAEACVYSLPNLSIAELVDYLKRRTDLQFHIIWHFDYRRKEVEEILENRRPRLVAISSTLAFYPQYLNDCIRWINERKHPETKVVVGGKWIYDRYKACEAGRELEATFVKGSADYYVVNGYGEETLYQLLLAERAGDRARAQALPNIAYRKRDSVNGTNGSKPLHRGKYYNINPVVEENQTPGSPMIDFENVGEEFLGKVVQVRTAVSCPFKCRFCTFPVLQGEHKTFDNEAVIAQLKQLKAMGVDYLYFIDDTFNVPLRRFEDLLDRMIEAKLDMKWVSFFRAQYSTPETVKKMYEAGCRLVFCGFESGNDGILKRMEKHVTVKQYVAGLEYLSKAGIYVMASYFVGYPGETYASAMDTLELMNHPQILFSRGGIFYYDVNAPVRRFADEWGLVGSGAEWRHDTMDSKEAARIHLEILDKLEGVNTPISDGGGWNNFHLYARGIGFKEQQRYFREFKDIQNAQISEAGTGAVEEYRAFARKPEKKTVEAASALKDDVAGAMPSMDF